MLYEAESGCHRALVDALATGGKVLTEARYLPALPAVPDHLPFPGACRGCIERRSSGSHGLGCPVDETSRRDGTGTSPVNLHLEQRERKPMDAFACLPGRCQLHTCR